MKSRNKLLAILSTAEQEALYSLPDFDDAQRLEYLALTESELAIANHRPGLNAQIYCILQIGYFRAKHAFVRTRYFHGQTHEQKTITRHEYYIQREWIAGLFGYQSWTANFLPQLGQQATQIVRRDVTPGFVAAELIVWLNEHKIVRPGIQLCRNWLAKPFQPNVSV